jgi:hypothetical protein
LPQHVVGFCLCRTCLNRLRSLMVTGPAQTSWMPWEHLLMTVHAHLLASGTTFSVADQNNLATINGLLFKPRSYLPSRFDSLFETFLFIFS